MRRDGTRRDGRMYMLAGKMQRNYSNGSCGAAPCGTKGGSLMDVHDEGKKSRKEAH